MKFLCVPCDRPMTLRTVGPPDRGSLSIVYSCPECGYEMAMLTNPYETQVVQSLGVRVGPNGDPAQMESSEAGQPASDGSKCPFAEMIPAASPAQPHDAASESGPIRWTSAAEARLANIPSFVRPMARSGIERFARERGCVEVDEKILDEARDFFGM